VTRWLDADPWMVPVPVAPSRYLALDPAQRPAEVYLRMLDEDPTHLPSMLPPQPSPRGDDEFANLQVSVLGDRRAQ
jgi:hypothetical protein